MALIPEGDYGNCGQNVKLINYSTIYTLYDYYCVHTVCNHRSDHAETMFCTHARV